MRKAEFREIIADSMRGLHSEGETWLYLTDTGRAATTHVEASRKPSPRFERLLKVMGIEHNRKSPREIVFQNRLYPTLARLEKDKAIATIWEHPGAQKKEERGRLMYRLLPGPEKL